MEHIQLTVSFPEARIPEFFDLLANSSAISEARLLEWNEAREDWLTLLYAVDGDAGELTERATETPGIESITASATEDGESYVMVEARPAAVPMFEGIHRARARRGLIVRKPVSYRDCAMRVRLIGDQASLTGAIEAVPEPVSVTVEEIGTVSGLFDRPGATLTDRQREAVATAVELGYYEQPRGTTHAAVATELGVVPATASDLLQRAEAKIIRRVAAGFAVAESEET